MRSNKPVVVFALVAASTAHAQSVTGVVLDDNTRTPLVASTIRYSIVQKSIAVPLLPPALRAGPFVDEVTRPAAFRPGNYPPVYPPGARRRAERGMVVAFAVVRADGKVDMSAVHLISTSEEFADAVRASLRSARFFPAEKDGQRCAQVVQVSYGFAFGADPIDGDVTIHATRP